MVRILLPLTAGVGVMLLMLTAVNAIAEMAHLSPSVGDIVAFPPSVPQNVDDDTRLSVFRSDQSGCILDLGVLRKSGGSFVVESEVAGVPGSFRVHWAGLRTTSDDSSCGVDADLILDRQDLDTMALAVGGYGVGQKRVPTTVVANGY